MLRTTRCWAFRMSMGRMHLDFKLSSRDHSRAIRVEDAVVDVKRPHCVAPLHWMDALRARTTNMPEGFYSEQRVFVPPPGKEDMSAEEQAKQVPNAIRAGPLLLYVVGQPSPAAVTVDFVEPEPWGFDLDSEELDLRVGRDVIEQTTLFSELRPGGLLSDEPLSVLKQRGLMQVGLAESPWARRPWTRMKYMQIDELQRGAPQTERLGHNPREGREWRFSQYCKHFRVGIWREATRTKDLVDGLHNHSSWQRSPQQAVPEVRNMAPFP